MQTRPQSHDVNNVVCVVLPAWTDKYEAEDRGGICEGLVMKNQQLCCSYAEPLSSPSVLGLFLLGETHPRRGRATHQVPTENLSHPGPMAIVLPLSRDVGNS